MTLILIRLISLRSPDYELKTEGTETLFIKNLFLPQLSAEGDFHAQI